MRAKSELIGILLLVLFAQLSADAQHESQAYLPLTKAEIRKKFPVKYVGTLGYERPGYFEGIEDKPFLGKLDIGPSGAVVIERNDNDLIITGKDRRNHDWSIQPGELAFSYACSFQQTRIVVCVFRCCRRQQQRTKDTFFNG